MKWTLSIFSAAFILAACKSPDEVTDKPIVLTEGACTTSADAPPDYLQEIPCKLDFEALASAPLDTSIPGARSVKVILDRLEMFSRIEKKPCCVDVVALVFGQNTQVEQGDSSPPDVAQLLEQF